jgi:hypothetical protein
MLHTKKLMHNVIGKVVFGQKVLFTNLVISQLGFWAKRVIHRVGYWLSSDNSTKMSNRGFDKNRFAKTLLHDYNMHQDIYFNSVIFYILLYFIWTNTFQYFYSSI